MFRRFRRGRRSKSQDIPASPNVPEKSPNGDTTPTIKNGRRRQRGAGAAGTPASTTPTAVETPESQAVTLSPRQAAARKSLVAITPSMRSVNLLEDMQAQLNNSDVPELPLEGASNHTESPARETTTTATSSSPTATPTTNTTTEKQPKRMLSQRAMSRKSKEDAIAAGAVADSGCLPRSSRSVEPTTSSSTAATAATTATTTLVNGSNNHHHHQHSPKASSSASSPPPTVTEDETDAWNRITKEAANWDRKGTEFFEKGEYDQAFLCYEKALTLKRQTLKPQDDTTTSPDGKSSEASLLASVATSINNMTYLRQRAGQATADETMAAYLQSLQMKREILGPHHLSVGKTLNNIGSVFYLQREYPPALKAYLQAFDIMESQLGDQHLDVGTVLSNIGDVYFAMGNKQDAKEHYRRALDVRWGALGPSDPKVVRLMEQLAFLETGKQPSKDSDDLSDSENEEYAVQDRLRHERFQEEVRVLQNELAEDMKFFDLLERKMAIDMVRDKTRMFRKMRQLTDMTMDDLLDVSESNYTDCYASEADMSVVSAPITESKSPSEADLLEMERRAITFEDLPVLGGANSSFLADTNEMLPQKEPTSSSAISFLERNNAALMSKEERLEALRVVRARLAALRAAREAEEQRKQEEQGKKDDLVEIDDIDGEAEEERPEGYEMDEDDDDDDDDDPLEDEETPEAYEAAVTGWLPPEGVLAGGG